MFNHFRFKVIFHEVYFREQTYNLHINHMMLQACLYVTNTLESDCLCEMTVIFTFSDP